MGQKRIAFFCILIFSLFITSCRSSNQYKYAQTIDSVNRIELLQIENGEEEILTELDNCDILADVQSLSCKKYWNDPCQIINGLAIKIYYNDSSCEIITWECTVYIKDNKRNYGWEYFDMDSFNATLQSYLDSN